ncbi:CaiB/BaiF CoA transferase family protein [Priestia flexa]|uniref:CaiB/BaiF CoA transferase family protein n=1 Tax=Priestia flexa TaxID=86664 RepID=UPI001B33795C|nr:CoA transferase [Priestia flexa]
MLQNVKVLSFTHFLQGPSAVQFLADMGADVIKIESPKGAYERHWSGINAFLNEESVFYLLAGRNQRSLSLDIRTDEGKEIIFKMIREADVIVENFRPGVMERLGFGYEDVLKINPSIIYASFSGFGSTGPYRDRPGQDLLLQAMSGLAQLNGGKDQPPTLVGSAIIDQHAAVLGALGIVGALYERTFTSKGKKVESNLLNAALDLQIEPFNYHLNGFNLYDRSESGISSRFHQAPYGIFETQNGYICLSLTPTDKLAKVFNDEKFLEWDRNDQFDKREEINARTAQHIKKHTTEYWYELFQINEIWCSLVNDYEQVESDPQLQWNKSIIDFNHPTAGKVRLLAHPVRYNGETLELRKLPPRLGEHTEEILKELGYDQETIEEYSKKGFIRECEKLQSKF